MRVIRLIDRGGFGRVEEVELPDAQRVARKTLDPRFELDKEDYEKLRKRFEREVKVQSTLPDHIVLPILGADLNIDNPWFLMPLAEKNYRDQIQEDRDNNSINLEAIADMLNALEELHHLGFVHRDLKPENLLLHDGKWKLSDFGFVMPLEDSASRYTSTSSAWGTEQYMAPEQVTSFKDVTELADIYSVGCIIHDLVSGSPRLPFQQQSCDGPLAPIVEKATEIDSSRRFPNIRKFRDALLTVLSEPPDSHGILAEEWVGLFEEREIWDVDRFSDFARYLRNIEIDSEEAGSICRALDEELLEDLYNVDAQTWSQIADFYIRWTNGEFDFAYCDLIVTRLNRILILGDRRVKAAAILAAAKLGSSHNRWFVMQQVLAMAGPKLDDAIASRVAIEIRVSEVQSDFIRSAQGINRNLIEYHPRIYQALQEDGIPF